MSIIASELTALLIADPGTAGAVPVPTKVGANNISAALELQSTTRGLCLPRMTTDQRDNVNPVGGGIAVPVNGMMIYNTTTNAVNTYENGAWGAGGAGDVDGPGVATNNALSVFDGVTGKLLAATSIIANPVTSIISGVLGLLSGAGTAATPTYSFSGDTNTGFYQRGADEIGVATAGVLQMSITGANTSINNLVISGAAAGAPLTITASGGSADIPINLVPKGLAGVRIDNGNGLWMTTGTEPTGLANTCQVFAATIAGNISLGMTISAASIGGSVDNVVTNKLQVKINGTTYYLLATTSAA